MISIHGATDLKSADWNGKSDPYVKVKLAQGKGEQSTSVVYKALNPTWENQTFEFLIANKDTEVIEFYVYDHDLFTAHDLIGFCSMPVAEGVSEHSNFVDFHTLDLLESKACSHEVIPFLSLTTTCMHDNFCLCVLSSQLRDAISTDWLSGTVRGAGRASLK